MGSPKSEQQINALIDPILGYINFGAGNFDPRFFSNLDGLFAVLAQTETVENLSEPHPTLQTDLVGTTRLAFDAMRTRLESLKNDNAAFRDAAQSEFVLEFTAEKLLPGYLAFHQDLLFHQTSDFLLNSFFVARAIELVLDQLHRMHLEGSVQLKAVDQDRMASVVISRLNDFLGHRPIATLETQKLEPYPHEFLRPVPLFIAGVGVAFGKYQELVTQTLKIIQQANPHLLRAAHFSPQRLQELAIDPRAFDFDHPITHRPNQHFGQWDERSIDEDGFFKRFILHQVTMDALLDRVDEAEQESANLSRTEALTEAASALACTMLMGSGISGNGPNAFDSNTSLGTLIPTIAAYRDQFYEELIEKLDEPHRQRLQEEQQIRHQPFGAVRQDLNSRLAQRRATQLINCRLAAIYARMGYPEAAAKQSQVVPVASARITCQIDCLISAGQDAIDSGDLDRGFESIQQAVSRLKTGIDCGAIVDPWNIIGFDGNYSLFPALENTVRDHRVFDLLDIMDRLFSLYSKLTSEAAAVDDEQMLRKAEQEFYKTVSWWQKYAAHEVSSVGAVDPEDLFEAASVVSQALNLWHRGGAAAGDMEFWAPHAEMFDTPKAYALVIDALMQREDYKTASALMVHWISQSDLIPLEHGDSSFHNLMFRWIAEQKSHLRDARDDPQQRSEIWDRIRKFHDFLEANASEYWEVPSFELGNGQSRSSLSREEYYELFDDDDDEEDDSDTSVNLYQAAYEEFTFNDSTDDGVEGEIHDGGYDLGDEGLEAEVERVLERLEFLATLAAYWNVAANVPLPIDDKQQLSDAAREQLKERRSFILDWVGQAARNRDRLLRLLESIDGYELKLNGSDRDSMLQYDQQRLNKEMLLEHTINTCIDTENAIRMMAAVIKAIDFLVDGVSLDSKGSDPESESDTSATLDATLNGGSSIVCVYAALLLNDERLIEEHFATLTQYLHGETLLYVPLSKGGNPASIVKARIIQTAIQELLHRLPANGMFAEAYELTVTTLAMERNNPVSGGAVTEFDEIFEIAYSAMVETLVRSTRHLRTELDQREDWDDSETRKHSQRVLFDCVEMLTESMLPLWLSHSKTLRLSVLEKVRSPKVWKRLVDFIRTYGEGLFTQSFFYLGNIRAILHQGVKAWLENVEQSPDVPDIRLFDELGSQLPRETAVRFLTIVLDAIQENFNEYVDYNSTTTQSDHGDQLDSFLDFLRLRARYDRVCWHLKPVVWAHRILVNEQENSVARMWRRSLTERVGPKADEYLEMLEELRRKYSIQMSSVGRRLEGRFAHQLQIDRLRALVAPSMDRPKTRKSERAFELLTHEAQAFLRSTSGVGVDLPEWLAELENEVHQFLLPRRLRDYWHEPTIIDPTPIPLAQLREKLEALPQSEPDA